MDTFWLILLVLFIVVMVIVGPHLVIWSINYLFNFNIGHTFTDWFATVVLCGVFAAPAAVNNKS